MNNDTKKAVISALEFYADKYNYSHGFFESCETAEILCDEGETARSVLELIMMDTKERHT